MKRSLVMLSGGIDSAVALVSAHLRRDEIYALSFRYHSRPFRERLAAYRLLEDYPGKLIEVSVPFLRPAQSHASATPIPEGYFSNRNMIFYSIAAHFAELHGCASIIAGHTAEDHQDFPDASVSFLDRLEALANEALVTGKIEIELPLASMSKLQVLEKAVEWSVPLHHTWSCYLDAPSPCGRCISCRERAVAFGALELSDPLLNRR